jgi:hypothetical protein
MAATVAHLVDAVMSEVPVRQWVLSLSYDIRFLLVYDIAGESAVDEEDALAPLAPSRPDSHRSRYTMRHRFPRPASASR